MIIRGCIDLGRGWLNFCCSIQEGRWLTLRVGSLKLAQDTGNKTKPGGKSEVTFGHAGRSRAVEKIWRYGAGRCPNPGGGSRC